MELGKNRLFDAVATVFGAAANLILMLVMAVVFFLLLTPAAVALRALGKDPLRLKRDPRAASYWLPRNPPGPSPGSLKNQF